MPSSAPVLIMSSMIVTSYTHRAEAFGLRSASGWCGVVPLRAAAAVWRERDFGRGGFDKFRAVATRERNRERLIL